MSKQHTLGEAIDLTSAAAQAAPFQPSASPFTPGMNVIGKITTNAAAGAGLVVKIQTSPDDNTWTDVLTMTGVGPDKQAEFTSDAYIRYNVTGAGSAGTANVYLEAGP